MRVKRYSFIGLVIIVLILAQALSVSAAYAQGPVSQFQEFQPIPTSGAIDWEFFTIGSDHFLAVANHFDGTTYNLDSKIYRWDGTAFVDFQSIATNGATDWEYFMIGSDHYLAVANQYNDSTYNVDSKLYKWNGASFVLFQSIATNGARDWEYFMIGSDHYLVVANGRNGSNFNINSRLYKWNGASFVLFQSIPTNWASDWEYFMIGSDHYLAVANARNTTTHNIDSKIYKWDGTSFVEVQAIPTSSAIDWEYFMIGSDHYLAVANAFNNSTVNIDSKVYKWNGANFVEVQAIPTNGARDWKYFAIDNTHYLVGANNGNGSTSNIDSKLYQWNGSSFLEFQAIPTSGAHSWEFFVIGTDSYLAVANQRNNPTFNIDSKIYRAIFPEIEVLVNNISISDETGMVSFGLTTVGAPITKTFTVQNLGTADLTLTPPVTLPVGFSLVNNFGTTTVSPTTSTTFEVQLDATTAGAFNGTLAFDNNDYDENPYNFVISGAVNQTAYLPVLLKNHVTGSDLVVENLTVNSSGVIVVLKNAALNVSVNTEFRVGLYIDPNPVPTVVNQPWSQLSTEGLVWNVTQPIHGGGQLALTINDPYYAGALSNYSGPPPPGTPVYAQVDSVNLNTSYGSVLESHEISGDVYNNIKGALAGP